jgi:hypothetical protein
VQKPNVMRTISETALYGKFDLILWNKPSSYYPSILSLNLPEQLTVTIILNGLKSLTNNFTGVRLGKTFEFFLKFISNIQNKIKYILTHYIPILFYAVRRIFNANISRTRIIFSI